jgi:DNA-binding transcriptional regulator YdaS (Cro superfamily)
MELKDYLKSKKMKMTQFAKLVGYSYPQIRRVIHKERYASQRLAKVIELATGGEVTVKELVRERK